MQLPRCSRSACLALIFFAACAVKTNLQGIAHVPQPPIGRVLIQVVAEGWKSYGHWYDITDAKQVVKIHLDRPPKWY